MTVLGVVVLRLIKFVVALAGDYTKVYMISPQSPYVGSVEVKVRVF